MTGSEKRSKCFLQERKKDTGLMPMSFFGRDVTAAFRDIPKDEPIELLEE